MSERVKARASRFSKPNPTLVILGENFAGLDFLDGVKPEAGAKLTNILVNTAGIVGTRLGLGKVIINVDPDIKDNICAEVSEDPKSKPEIFYNPRHLRNWGEALEIGWLISLAITDLVAVTAHELYHLSERLRFPNSHLGPHIYYEPPTHANWLSNRFEYAAHLFSLQTVKSLRTRSFGEKVAKGISILAHHYEMKK